MKKKVSLFLTALCCAVGAVSASEVDSVQVAEVHGNVAARKQRTDNDEYTRFRVGGYGEAVASFKDYGINRYYGNPNGNTRDHRNTISIPILRLVIKLSSMPMITTATAPMRLISEHNFYSALCAGNGL